jgi:hypothetical protein
MSVAVSRAMLLISRLLRGSMPRSERTWASVDASQVNCRAAVWGSGTVSVPRRSQAAR